MRSFFHGHIDCCRIFIHSCGNCIHDTNRHRAPYTYTDKHVHRNTNANPYVDALAEVDPDADTNANTHRAACVRVSHPAKERQRGTGALFQGRVVLVILGGL
jgi:hypothetical protein